MPGWLQEIYRRENAHNNFLQILGELGVAGFAVFIWLIVDALRRAFSGFRPGRPDWRRAGLLAGISAFLLTWLSGHPLLTPDVAYAFWIALGTAVALGAVQQTRPVSFQRRRELWVGVCVVAVVCSVPVRIHNERQSANLTGVAYGVYGWETERDGTRFRWIRQNGTFFIPATAKAVEIPVRALHLDGNPGPTEVTLSIDGRLANALRLEDDRWVRTRILLPSAAPDARSRRIDVVVDHTWSVADGSDNRRLGIKVGELGVQVEKR
jgi:hypothetical protein